MQQKENISELLRRYILNECSPEETEAVISYFRSATNSNDLPSVVDVLNLLKEHRKLENISSDISFPVMLKVAKEKDQVANSKVGPSISWRKYASIAAIFFGVMLTGYFFWQNQNADDILIIPPDAITLELEDGSIEILSEDGSKDVVDKNGKLLGRQSGNLISYEKTGSTEELVYNTLTVPYGKRFDLKLSDGTIVYLNAGTSLRYPVKFLDEQNREVYLTGEAFFEVSKDSLHPFVVGADRLDVRVLGTQFNISSYPEDDSTDVVLVEGSVGMHGKTETFNENTSTILTPGFKGSFEKSNGTIKTQAVVTEVYSSWIDGQLVFRNMTFENILKKMERHYDVSIINNNHGLANEVFNASYGKVSLQKVFEDLKQTHGIEYSIEGTDIIIN